MSTISEDEELIKAIADRAKVPDSWSILVWKLKETHFDICPLRLADLLAAPDEEFNQEIDGIVLNIDVLNGSFHGGWKPRFAK
jgi:hypothetical protein